MLKLKTLMSNLNRLEPNIYKQTRVSIVKLLIRELPKSARINMIYDNVKISIYDNVKISLSEERWTYAGLQLSTRQ